MSDTDFQLSHLEPSKALSHLEAMRFLMRYVGAAKLALLAGLLLLTSLTEGVGLLLLVPITQLLAAGPADAQQIEWLSLFEALSPAMLLGGFAALVCLRSALVFATNQTRTAIDLSLILDLRSDAQRALLRAEWRWLAGRHSADHEALLLGEVSRVGLLLDQAVFLVSALLTLIILISAAALIAPGMTLAVIAIAAVFAFPFLLLKRRTARDAEGFADAYADLHRVVSGGIRHLRSARIAGAADLFEQRFAIASGELKRIELAYVRNGHILTAAIQGLAAIALAALAYFALVRGDVSVSVFVPLLALLARAAPLLAATVQSVRQWILAKPALARIQDLIEQAHENAEARSETDVAAIPTLKEGIQLRDVTLQFEGNTMPVFAGLTCSIPAGAITAVVGPSGSGKSSLGDLVSGLLVPDDGEIRIDGTPLVNASRLAWRDKVGYAEQSPYLFSGTLRENLAWAASDITDAQVHAALEAASAQFVQALPNGLDTKVLEDGRSLSGGEAQRLALARALLRRPELLILDEVTASLDRKNREMIYRSVANLKGSASILLLTHDEELAQLADHVIDLSNLPAQKHG